MAFLMRQELAEWGENTANEFLTQHGVLVLTRNYRTRYGEIDLIGVDDKIFVFFEVKARQSTNFGFPEDSVSNRKLEKIETVGWHFLQERHAENEDWRIDIIAILRNPKTNTFDIQWIKNVSADD